MKTIPPVAAVAFTVVVVTGCPAFSADRLVAAKPPADTTSWTGVYAGVSVGGAWARENGTLALVENNGSTTAANEILTTAGSPGFSPSSAIAGGQLGFNYQFAPQFVAGVEADWSYLGVDTARQTASIARGPDPSVDLREDVSLRSMATLRARLGVLVTPQLLLFATGGLALADIGYSQRIHFAQVPDTSFNRVNVSGWRSAPVVGIGGEYALGPHWSLKAEYLYASIKTPRVDSVNSFDSTYQLQHGLDAKLSIGRVGVNYRF